MEHWERGSIPPYTPLTTAGVMAQAAGGPHCMEAALQRHLEELHLTTPQQQQLTAGALCRGIAARDPAWVAVLAAVVDGAPRAIQQQLAAQPGLLKDLAAYVTHNLLSSSTAGCLQQPAAAGPSVGGCVTTRSSSRSGKKRRHAPCPHAPTGSEQQQQQQQRGSTSGLEADTAPSSSSRQEVEAAGGALAHLLRCCDDSVPPPPYQDLAPALHAALQQRLVCLPALVVSFFLQHCARMATDQQLLGIVLDAAEQGERPDLLAFLAPPMLKCVEHSHPAYQPVHGRVSALLAGGAAAGAAFLAAALQQGGTLWQVPGMVEAACSGLLAACHEAAAVDARRGVPTQDTMTLMDLPPAHAVCLQYLRGLVGVVQYLATHHDPAVRSRLGVLSGHLVPTLAEALCLLLQSMQLPDSTRSSWGVSGSTHRPYHDAAWSALLALCQCPGAAALVAALFQHQPGLLQALATSWDMLLQNLQEPSEEPALLAFHLLFSSSIPGQEERRQQEQLLVAAVELVDRVWPEYWGDQAGQLMELIRLPHGSKAVVRARHLLRATFRFHLLGPEHKEEGWALLLAAPGFSSELVGGVCKEEDWALEIVEVVWQGGVPEHFDALQAMPGLSRALAGNCQVDWDCAPVDRMLADAVAGSPVMQAYLAQEPELLDALLLRLRTYPEYSGFFWHCLAEFDVGYEWVLQQPNVLDAVVAALVVVVSSRSDQHDVAERLLEMAPVLVRESLLRQPSALEDMLRTLVRWYWQLRSPTSCDCDVPLMLLNSLASSNLAPRAQALLQGLLAKSDAELSTGVFEAVHLIQMRMWPMGMDWCPELAATCSRGAVIVDAEEQLQALRQGVAEVQGAAASTAAAMRQLQQQQQQQQQQDVDMGGPAERVGVGSSGRKCKGHPGQVVVAAACSTPLTEVQAVRRLW